LAHLPNFTSICRTFGPSAELLLNLPNLAPSAELCSIHAELLAHFALSAELLAHLPNFCSICRTLFCYICRTLGPSAELLAHLRTFAKSAELLAHLPNFWPICQTFPLSAELLAHLLNFC